MKIKMTDSRIVAGRLMESGAQYDVPDELADQLTYQNVAVKVMVEREKPAADPVEAAPARKATRLKKED